jgi:asparagine synthase (glutamine-hydrolysing)
MCGIGGLVFRQKKANPQDVNTILERMVHRGPDGIGDYSFENIVIGHRRLSIIDLETGSQPLCNEDGTIWLTFNGELYNYLEIREVLVSKGHYFKSNSDSEVIVHAYEEWGCSCLDWFRGMFAFCILDQVKRKLFIARDHFGIKPLVYFEGADFFGFASEVKALSSYPGVDRSLDLTALDLYLQFQYIPAPYTIFKSIRKLPAAHFMLVDFDGRIDKLERYWQFKFQNSSCRSEAEWVEGLDAALQESVKAHLMSDVPFGAFLSGGVDSSLVVGYMARVMDQPVKTFNIGFNDTRYSEYEYGREVAEFWGTEHFFETVTPDAMAILPRIVSQFGEPYGDSSALPTWYVSRLASQHVKMVLTGDGADEFFGGYHTYTDKWSRHLNHIPSQIKGIKRYFYPVAHHLMPNRYPYMSRTLRDWLRYRYCFDDTLRSSLLKTEVACEINDAHRQVLQEYFEVEEPSHYRRVQSVDVQTYLPDDILVKVDVSGMSHGLEARTPFTDLRVADFAAKVPEHMNIRNHGTVFQGKYLLKKILSRNFSESFINRRKKGFDVPFELWFRPGAASASEIASRLLDDRKLLHSYFNAHELNVVATGEDRRKQWLLLILQEWLAGLP